MIGNVFRHVRQGEPLKFSASFHNLTADLLQRDAQRRGFTDTDPGVFELDPDLILIKNTSSSNVARFQILSLDSSLFSPTTSANAFKERIIFNGALPNSNALGLFAIATEPIGTNKIGTAIASGLSQVVVNFGSNNGSTADLIGGETRWLQDAGSTGIAQILWRDGGTSTGTNWTLVRIGAAGGFKLPTPRAKYDVLLVYNTSGDVAFDHPRFA